MNITFSQIPIPKSFLSKVNSIEKTYSLRLNIGGDWVYGHSYGVYYGLGVGMLWEIQGLKNEYLQGLKGDLDIIFGVICGVKVTFGD